MGRLRRAVWVLFIAGLWLGAAGAVVVGYYAARLPSETSWTIPERPANIRIIANNGALLANRGDTGGELVRLSELPDYLPQAVIAIEDRRFRSHFGIDPIGLARAMFTNVSAGRVVQGGSTITQQLAKNLFLTPDRTIERKIQEVVLALWLEARYSKDDILELYLNRVYLGGGAYGVDAAAHRYYGKSAREVTLVEAATLAGLLRAPSRLSPLTNPEGAAERARLAIAAMREEGYLTDREASLGLSAEAPVSRPVAGGSGSYVADWVVTLLPHLVGKLEKDVIVDTTIDLGLQAEADKALNKGLKENGEKYGVSQGAVVVLDGTGAVRAMVGGRDYARSQFNRAVDARRQPGSAFKPFVYLAALEQGYVPESVMIDQPVSIRGWSPENYSRQYYGPVTLQSALAMSLNTVAAQLAQAVGPAAVVATAKRLGINSPLQALPSIALGTSEVTPLELTAAFTPFANGGYGVIPHVVKRITTVDGTVIYERHGEGSGRVVDPERVGMMNAMLRETLVEGTGKRASIEGWPAAGKTGTSQEFRDAWFVGYTANLTAGVWLGNDDSKPTKRASGGNLPAMVWHDFMTAAHRGVPVADLPGNYQYRGQDNRAYAEGPGGYGQPGYHPGNDGAYGQPGGGYGPPGYYEQPRGGGIGGFLRRLFGG